MLPLFPLEIVLFPGMTLPLHIFEERYKQLMTWCLRSEEPFGVVHESGGDRASVGSSAEGLKLLNRYPDGRLDVLAQGRRRFRVVSLDLSLPYLQAEVEWLEEPEEELEQERTAVLDLFRRTYWSHGLAEPLAGLAKSPRLSFAVGRSQLFGTRQHQLLLELNSERERLAWLTRFLRKAEPVVKAVGGNGHPPAD